MLRELILLVEIILVAFREKVFILYETSNEPNICIGIWLFGLIKTLHPLVPAKQALPDTHNLCAQLLPPIADK